MYRTISLYSTCITVPKDFMKDVMGAGRINNDEKKRRGLHLFLTASSIAGTSTSGGCGILGISRATIVVRRSIIIRIVVASVAVRICHGKGTQSRMLDKEECVLVVLVGLRAASFN